MTASCCQTSETLRESIAAALQEKKPVMLGSLAERFGVSELEVAKALPDGARAFAGKDAFDAVWQALASWENATFIMEHLGSVVEIKGRIPEGKHGHGYFNLMGGSGLGGHLKIDDLDHICFLSLPFMGLESHSVQFFNAAGTVLFSVYVGRENRQLIPAARESFFALREAVGMKEPS
ncbi:heme utilization cystosolic carrier protein HutX [uncultured Bilophila sp.]|uniref:heme utilization cystosolic carrier protein HutX n=1 Tax=uncultured Bilophila sp. TaxID=529385 RepID=UPI00280A593D|nr:heme utilization cystosolic carrier protein HutX [uncultured Bilophila sp.]